MSLIALFVLCVLCASFLFKYSCCVNVCIARAIIILYEVRRDMEHKLELLFVLKNMCYFFS